MKYYNPKLSNIVLTPLMGFDTEFNDLDTKHGQFICHSLYNENGDSYVCEVLKYTKEEFVEFFERVQKEVDKLLSHNAKVEIGILYSNFGVLLRNCWCTMLASQIIDNGLGYQVGKDKLLEQGYSLPEDYEQGSKLYYTGNMVGNIPYLQSPHGLIGVIKRYLGIIINSHKDKKRLQMSFVNYTFKDELTKEQLDYALSDVEYLIPLYKEQLTWINDRKLSKIIEMERKLTPVLIKMEFRGCKIDIELHKQNIEKWKNKLTEITQKLDDIIIPMIDTNPKLRIFNFDRKVKTIEQLDLFGGGKITIISEPAFNYTSGKQLAELFTLSGVECPKDKDGKVSFGEECVLFYNTNNPDNPFHTFIDLLLDYREYEKLLGTYSEKLLDNLDGDRIRTSYSQCWTDTGRLASAEIKKGRGLNLANIPKNPDIRKIFIPDDGFVFIDSDMTGQELVIAGDFAQEPVLLKAFQEGFDHHSFLSSISYSLIFGQKIEIKNESIEIKIDDKIYDIKKLRDEHKSALFSKVYLGGPARIQAILNKYLVNHIAPEERFETCKKISNALDKSLRTLIKWLKAKVDEAQQNGFITANKLGRRRYFDNPERVYGDAANMPIQGTGADAMKIAMIRLDKFFEEEAAKRNIPEEEFGYLTLSVYDQVLCNINEKYIQYSGLDKKGKPIPTGLALQIPKIMGESITYFLTTLTGCSDLNIRTYWGK